MSKTITIKTTGYMAEKMPGKKTKFEFAIANNDTIADCIVALGLRLEDDYIVLVDGKFKMLDYCLMENETVVIMYMVGGG